MIFDKNRYFYINPITSTPFGGPICILNLIPARNGMGLWPDREIVGASPSPSASFGNSGFGFKNGLLGGCFKDKMIFKIIPTPSAIILA